MKAEAKNHSTLVISAQAPNQSATARCACCKNLCHAFGPLNEHYRVQYRVQVGQLPHKHLQERHLAIDRLQMS